MTLSILSVLEALHCYTIFIIYTSWVRSSGIHHFTIYSMEGGVAGEALLMSSISCACIMAAW